MEADDASAADKTDIPDHPGTPSGCQFTGDLGVSDEDCDRIMPATIPAGLSYDCKDIDGFHIGYTCCDHLEGETFVWWTGDKANLFTCRRNAVDDADSNMEATSLDDMDVWLSESEESSSAGVSTIAAAVLTGAVAALL